MKVLITGSAGLVGSEAVRFFCDLGFEVHGVDNNMRRTFFGPDGDTTWVKRSLVASYKDYHHHDIDIRDERKLTELYSTKRFDLIIHAAAQPSHDWAAKEPLTDFSINAGGTLLLLELARRYCPETVFIFMSTNKVYGDRPNSLPLVEKKTRWELPTNHRYYKGFYQYCLMFNELLAIYR